MVRVRQVGGGDLNSLYGILHLVSFEPWGNDPMAQMSQGVAFTFTMSWNQSKRIHCPESKIQNFEIVQIDLNSNDIATFVQVFSHPWFGYVWVRRRLAPARRQPLTWELSVWTNDFSLRLHFLLQLGLHPFIVPCSGNFHNRRTKLLLGLS